MAQMGASMVGAAGSYMDTGYIRASEGKSCCNMCDVRTMKQHSPAGRSTVGGFNFLEAMELGRRRGGQKKRKKNTRSGLSRVASAAAAAAAAAAATSSSALLEQEQNHQKKGFLGGALANAAMSGMASTIQAKGGCCPICPNLQTILNSNVPIDETFGGPFAPAMESKESGGKIEIYIIDGILLLT